MILASLTLIASLAAAEPRCATPDQDFPSFLTHFRADRGFQVDRVVYPLSIRFGDGRATEFVYARWDRQRVVREPDRLILTSQQLKRVGLERTRQLGNGKMEVYDFRPDADSYQRAYYFRLTDGCWYLESIRDTSL